MSTKSRGRKDASKATAGLTSTSNKQLRRAAQTKDKNDSKATANASTTSKKRRRRAAQSEEEETSDAKRRKKDAKSDENYEESNDDDRITRLKNAFMKVLDKQNENFFTLPPLKRGFFDPYFVALEAKDYESLTRHEGYIGGILDGRNQNIAKIDDLEERNVSKQAAGLIEKAWQG
jgi:uncharacterized membrane protein YqiK